MEGKEVTADEECKATLGRRQSGSRVEAISQYTSFADTQ
jgi:hypothetical protein